MRGWVRQTFFGSIAAMQSGALYRMLEVVRRFRSYLKISGVAGISRRYFVMNSFDGAMTMLGVIVGAHSTGASDPRIIIGAGVGATLAMGMSGFSGAYLTERAERLRRLKGLKRAMLSDMRRSVHAKAPHAASLWAAFVDGISPALAAAIPMTPYVLALLRVISLEQALLTSVALIMATLFGLGAFLGRISKENMLVSGLRMIIVGAATAFIVLLLGVMPA